MVSDLWKLLTRASMMHGDRRVVRRDRATAAHMEGAANALGALYAAADGIPHHVLQTAMACCHDATGVHPSRWELKRIQPEQGFALAIERARGLNIISTESSPGEIPAPTTLECTCNSGVEALRDPSKMYDSECFHSQASACPNCGGPRLFITGESCIGSPVKLTCTRCGHAWKPSPLEADEQAAAQA